jgi:isoleucyl-tRNA synthetase
MWMILDTLTKMFAPILAFTCDEIWQVMPHRAEDDARNVVLNDMNKTYDEYTLDAEAMAKWELIEALRADVNKALELARAEKAIGKPLDAEVTLYISAEAKENFDKIAAYDLPMIFIVSKVNAVDGEGEGFKGESFAGVTVKVVPSEEEKCSRCWTHSHTVGENADHPELCARCAAVVSAM